MNYFNQNGHLTEESISLYVDAMILDKTDQLPAVLPDHIENCLDCHQQIIELYSVVKKSGITFADPHPTLKAPATAIKNRSGFYLLRIFVAILLGGLIYMIVPKGNTENSQQETPTHQELKVPAPVPSDTLNKQDTIATRTDTPIYAEETNVNQEKDIDNQITVPDDKELFAANFTPYDELEGMAGEVFRTNEVDILSPKNNTDFKQGESILFQWEGIDDNATVVLINNTGKEMLRIQPEALSMFKLVEPLQPGLYYWKLETEEDLFYVGKFEVSN